MFIFLIEETFHYFFHGFRNTVNAAKGNEFKQNGMEGGRADFRFIAGLVGNYVSRVTGKGNSNHCFVLSLGENRQQKKLRTPDRVGSTMLSALEAIPEASHHTNANFDIGYVNFAVSKVRRLPPDTKHKGPKPRVKDATMVLDYADLVNLTKFPFSNNPYIGHSSVRRMCELANEFNPIGQLYAENDTEERPSYLESHLLAEEGPWLRLKSVRNGVENEDVAMAPILRNLAIYMASYSMRWLFVQQWPVKIENQLDQEYAGRCSKVVAALTSIIHATDVAMGFKNVRSITFVARKYGLNEFHAAKGVENTYDTRKSASVAVTRSYFKNGQPSFIAHLDRLLESGKKLDDVCDAVLMGMAALIDDYRDTRYTESEAGQLAEMMARQDFITHTIDATVTEPAEPASTLRSSFVTEYFTGESTSLSNKRPDLAPARRPEPREVSETAVPKVASESVPAEPDAPETVLDLTHIQATDEINKVLSQRDELVHGFLGWREKTTFALSGGKAPLPKTPTAPAPIAAPHKNVMIVIEDDSDDESLVSASKQVTGSTRTVGNTFTQTTTTSTSTAAAAATSSTSTPPRKRPLMAAYSQIATSQEKITDSYSSPFASAVKRQKIREEVAEERETDRAAAATSTQQPSPAARAQSPKEPLESGPGKNIVKKKSIPVGSGYQRPKEQSQAPWLSRNSPAKGPPDRILKALTTGDTTFYFTKKSGTGIGLDLSDFDEEDDLDDELGMGHRNRRRTLVTGVNAASNITVSVDDFDDLHGMGF